jgi:hypothetical protein
MTGTRSRVGYLLLRVGGGFRHARACPSSLAPERPAQGYLTPSLPRLDN